VFGQENLTNTLFNGESSIATLIELRKSFVPLLVLILLSAYPLTIVQLVKASVENVGTSCSIFVDDIVEPQPITVIVQIYPAPPEGEIFNDISIVIVSPLQGTVGNNLDTGPWEKSFSSDTDGKATVTFDIHTFGGYWIVDFYFWGQYFANDTIYYEPLQSHENFFVSSIETPTPSPTVSPSPSPEPTFSPEPSVPTSTPLPSEEPQQLGQDVFLGVVGTVAVLAVGLGLLVYFKKRKQ
jgi:hypothetical protein